MTVNNTNIANTFIGWRVTFKNGSQKIGYLGQLVPGINIVYPGYPVYPSSHSMYKLLIVNTTDTSIIRLECNGITSSANIVGINLTIYGMLNNYYRA